MAIYMKIPGVKGNVTARGFEGAIELITVGQLSSRAVSQDTGIGHHREMSAPYFHHARITKSGDSASGALYHYFCSAKVIDQVEIYHCPSASDSSEWSSKFTLHHVVIASHQEDLNSMGSLEDLELAYTKIEKGYRQQDSKGNFHSPSYTGYDMSEASCI